MAISNNKFARQNDANSARHNTGAEKVTIDQQLARLEEDIRRLKIEYDVFFNGGAKRAPYDTKNRVESVLKRLGDERSLTFAQRYQYNSLVARFTSFRELWRRTMQGREEARESIHQAKAVNQAQAEKQPPAKSSFVCSNVQQESSTVEQIYNALLRAKESCGESVKELSFTQFQQQLTAQTEKFKQAAKCEKVAFEIGAENGRVVFKARPEK